MHAAAIHRMAIALMAGIVCSAAVAKLPALTPEQQQAEAAKKEQAKAQAEKEKQELAASMEKIAARWRGRAAANGWQTHPQMSVTAGPPASSAGNAAASLPVRSEKAGTAPPSADVKDPAKKGK
ncbi:MAG: hypothetical protein JWQ23_621 [Herminiimonas sp.]|nr:hypothetical protein [Herminiimonas sp.]